MIFHNTKHFNNIHILTILFDTLVISKLLYASLICDPYLQKDIVYLEKVKKRFLKFCYVLKHHTYPPQGHDYLELCKEFNTLTLDDRRKIIKCKFIFGLINNTIDSPFLLDLIFFKVPRQSARSTIPFVPMKPSTSTGYYAPIHRAITSFYEIFSDNCCIDIFNTNPHKFNTYIKHYFLSLRNPL